MVQAMDQGEIEGAMDGASNGYTSYRRKLMVQVINGSWNNRRSDEWCERLIREQ
jgi:hypothetical protein